jgi:hypothetical protein
LRIEAPDPDSIDGAPADVAAQAIGDALRVAQELRRYLGAVEVQVRNAVMQQAVEAGLPQPHEYWEQSKELRVSSAVAREAFHLATALALLATVYHASRPNIQRRDAIGSELAGERGSGRGAAKSK